MIDTIINWARRKIGRLDDRFVSLDEGSAFIDTWRGQKAPSQTTLIRSYTGIAFACGNLNALAFASVPLRLYVVTRSGQPSPKVPRRKISRVHLHWLRSSPYISPIMKGALEVEEVMEHPLLEALEKANDEMDMFSLFEYTDLYQEFEGNAYWLMEIDKILGIPTKFWILPSHRVHPRRNKETGILTFEYSSGGTVHTYTSDQILWFKFPNLQDPYGLGWSPVRAAYESVNILGMHNAYVAAMLENRARPDLMVIPKKPIGPVGALRFKKRFLEKFRKARNEGVFVAETEVDIKPLGFPPKDIQMLALYGVTKIELANAFGVPMSLLETKDVNKSNAFEGRRQHARNATLPRCRRFEQHLNARLCPRYDPRLFVAFDNPVPEDVEEKIRIRESNLNTYVTTINEEREEMGQNPVSWGSEPWMNSMYQQPSAIIVDVMPRREGEESEDGEKSLSKESDLPAPAISMVEMYQTLSLYYAKKMSADEAAELLKTTAHLDAASIQECLGLSAEVEETFDHGKEGPPKNPRKDWHLKFYKRGHRRRLPSAGQLSRKMVAFFQKQRVAVVRDIQKFILLGVESKAWSDPLDLSGWNDELAKQGRPYIEMYYDEGGEDFVTRTGMATEERRWNVQLPQVQEAIDSASMRFAQSTNRTTSLQLNRAIGRLREELAQGLLAPGTNTVRELTRRVAIIFNRAEMYRARSIAVTESSRAVHGGQVIAAKESGIVRGLKWLCSADACDLCQQIAADNRGGIPLGGIFATVGGDPDYSDIPHPPAHPNCMCTITEVLERLEE